MNNDSDALAEMRAYQAKYAGTTMGLACGRAAQEIERLRQALAAKDGPAAPEEP